MKKIIILLSLVVMIIGLTACDSYKLLNQEVTTEYGDLISTTASDYIDTKNMDKEEIKLMEDSVKVKLSEANIKDKVYPNVGDYEIIIAYKNVNYNVTLHVVDTKKPEFNLCSSIQIIEGETLNYEDYIVGTDLSQVETTFDDTKVNLKKVGKYKLIATAIDIYENKTVKEIDIIVSERTEKGEVKITKDEKTQNVTSEIIPIKKIVPITKPSTPKAPVNAVANETAGTIDGVSYTKMYDSVKAYSYYMGTDARGASGNICTRGTCAVDTSVIPMGTRLYIEGYGYAVANDTGGDIKGKTVDVYMSSTAECYQWGIKYVKVYVLD